MHNIKRDINAYHYAVIHYYNVRFCLENIVIEIILVSILFGCYVLKRLIFSFVLNKIIFNNKIMFVFENQDSR